MNVFDKPNEQYQACLSIAMARKQRIKSNVFDKRELTRLLALPSAEKVRASEEFWTNIDK